MVHPTANAPNGQLERNVDSWLPGAGGGAGGGSKGGRSCCHNENVLAARRDGRMALNRRKPTELRFKCVSDVGCDSYFNKAALKNV